MASPRPGSRRRVTSSQAATVRPPAKRVAAAASAGSTSVSSERCRTRLSRTAKTIAAASANAEPDPLHVLRPARLAHEHDPADHDQEGADDHARLRGLVEQHEGDRDGEERRGADGHRRARRPRVADGEREEKLRAARTEHAGEQERPDAAELELARRGERQRHREARRRSSERAGLRVRDAHEREAERDRHRAEEGGRGQGEHDRVHRTNATVHEKLGADLRSCHARLAEPGAERQRLQFRVGVKMAASGQRVRGGGRSLRLGRRREDRDPAARRARARASISRRTRIGSSMKKNATRHETAVNSPVGERQLLRAGLRRSCAPDVWPRERHHVSAVVEAERRRSRSRARAAGRRRRRSRRRGGDRQGRGQALRGTGSQANEWTSSAP